MVKVFAEGKRKIWGRDFTKRGFTSTGKFFLCLRTTFDWATGQLCVSLKHNQPLAIFSSFLFSLFFRSMSVAKNVVLMPGNTQHISPVFLSDDINNDHSSCPQQSLRLYPPSPPSTMTATTPVSMASAPTSPQSPLSFRNDFTPSKMPWYSSQNTSLRPIAQHIPRPSIESDNSSANFFNLDRLMQQYGEQPELLELILSSKVEEDRRRAEEAKLKRKEIDYLLLQKQQDIDTAQRTAYRSWRVGSQNVTPCEMVRKKTISHQVKISGRKLNFLFNRPRIIITMVADLLLFIGE